MATRILIIHRQLVFAVTVKQALEQTGGFAVHPFTKADAAFDFLRDQPQDLAIVDFELSGRSGVRLVQQLRAIQPDLAIIATPRPRPELEQGLNLQGSIDAPFSARELIPLIQNALDQAVQIDHPIEPGSTNTIRDAWGDEVGSAMTTRSLNEQRLIRQRQYGTTDHLGPEPDSQDIGAGTAQLPSSPPGLPEQDAVIYLGEPQPDPLGTRDLRGPEPPEARLQTRPLREDIPLPQGNPDWLETHLLDDHPLVEGPGTKPFADEQRPSATDALRTSDLKRPSTKPFTDEEPPPSPLVQSFSPVDMERGIEGRRPSTKPFTDDEPAPSPLVSSFSSRDLGGQPMWSEDVLRAIADDEDTPLPSPDETPIPAEPIRPIKPGTRRIANVPPPAESDFLRTRQLPPESTKPLESASTRNIGGRTEPPTTNRLPVPPVQEGDTAPLPRSQPPAQDFSSLDAILQDYGGMALEEPPPPRPSAPIIEPDRFGDILAAVEAADYNDRPKQQRQVDFEGLVRSMRSETPPSRLPDRQQFMDFIVTTGMESVLKEIEKNKTGPLDQMPTPPLGSPSFERLAQEEPPVPGLTENGTVSDLLTSISGGSFQDVISLLSDTPEDDSSPAYVPSDDLPPTERKRPPGLPSAQAPVADDFAFNFDDELGQDSVAHVVLQSTRETAAQPGDFSVDRLITDIEERLSTHQLRMRPLPSWDSDTTAFFAVTLPPSAAPAEAPPSSQPAVSKTRPQKNRTAAKPPAEAPEPRLEEPSFLPEDFTSGILVPPVLPEDLSTPDAEDYWAPFAHEATLPPLPAYPPDAPTRRADRVEDWEAPAAPAPDDLPEGYPEGAAEPTIPHDYAAQALPLNREDFWTSPEAFPPAAPEPAAEWAPEAWATTPVYEQAPPYAPPDQASLPEPDLTWESAPTDDDWSLPSAGPADWSSAPATPALSPEEAYLAQLALNLTQVSLELSAEATVLTRGNQMIAASGHLSGEDTAGLVIAIANDWSTGDDGARLRFITLPSSGKDYMLYSVRTEDDMVLSMVFAGSTPLRVIRQQGERLMRALKDVPEETPAQRSLVPAAERKPSPLALETYSYVWVTGDPDHPLTEAAAHSIQVGLRTQLSELGWQIYDLQAHQDHVYLLADVPGERPTHQIIDDLRARSARIAQAQNSDMDARTLWSPSYLVLSPGRALAPEEIQEFIEFERWQ